MYPVWQPLGKKIDNYRILKFVRMGPFKKTHTQIHRLKQKIKYTICQNIL